MPRSALRAPRCAALALAMLLSLLFVGRARAQGWLPDRDAVEGPGFRIGRLELHPGIASELGYDSNVFLEAEDPDAGLILRLTGHVDISTLGSQRRREGEAPADESSSRVVDFRAGIGASYHRYFRVPARSNVEANIDVDALFNPDGRFSVRLQEQFGRTIRPFTDPAESMDELPTFIRHQNVLGVHGLLSSRGGLLNGGVGYENRLGRFKDQRFDYLDTVTHGFEAHASWRFLPTTAIVQKNELMLVRYTNEDDEPVALVNDALRVRSTIGINGAITNKISLTVSGGYSVGFIRGAEDYESFNAQVEGRFEATERIRIVAGYFRRFHPSFVGNFVRVDQLYADAAYMIAGRLRLELRGSVSFGETGLAFLADGTTPLGNQPRRNDIRVRADLGAEYRFVDAFGITAQLGYLDVVTDYRYTGSVPGLVGSVPDPGAGFYRIEAWLGLRVSY